MSVLAVEGQSEWTVFEFLLFGAWFDGHLVCMYKVRKIE